MLDAVRLRAILNAIPQMVWSARPDGRADMFSAQWAEFTGVPAEAVDGGRYETLFHPDDCDRARALWRECIESGEPYEVEYRLQHRDGGYRWVLCRAVPIRGEDGAILRWFGTCTDIHALKLSEQARQLIASELSHRIKNIFAVIGSLISLSARRQPHANGFAEGIMERIGTLARAHDYLRPEPSAAGRQGAENLHGLLNALVDAYQEGEQKRILVEGDNPPIGAHAATALAIIIHELATNAIKYGALSAHDGRVHLVAQCSGDLFSLTWREEGGPPVAGEPDHEGFGTQIAKRSAAAQLQATITEEWHPAGLRLQLTLPVAHLRR